MEFWLLFQFSSYDVDVGSVCTDVKIADIIQRDTLSLLDTLDLVNKILSVLNMMRAFAYQRFEDPG